MKKSQELLKELNDCGIFKSVTSEEKFLTQKPGSGVYIGFDPTAQSLHLGNYIQLMLLKRFEQFGFKPYAVIGGATGMIGDPSGRSSERVLLDQKTLAKNIQKITKQIGKFGIEVINNATFYAKMNVIAYLRDVGKLINVSQMLAKESVSTRLQQGISYTEFSYQLLQGWDFKCCYEQYGITMQVGGSDQWGNITTGIDIINKTQGKENNAVGLTVNLLLDKDGNKYGKSSGGTPIWLDQTMTSPNGLYQFLYATPDTEVRKLLSWLTTISLTAAEEIMTKHERNKRSRFAQKQLAYLVTKNIHGEEAAKTAEGVYETQIQNFDNTVAYANILNWEMFQKVLVKHTEELKNKPDQNFLNRIGKICADAELTKWKNTEEIFKEMRVIAEKDSKSPLIFLVWAWFLCKTSNFEKAISKLETSAQLDRNNPITFLLWASALNALNNAKLANKKMVLVLQFNKNNLLDFLLK